MCIIYMFKAITESGSEQLQQYIKCNLLPFGSLRHATLELEGKVEDEEARRRGDEETGRRQRSLQTLLMSQIEQQLNE